MKSKTLIIAVILILAGVIIFLVQQGTQDPTLQEETPSGQEGTDTDPRNEEGAEADRVVQIEGGEYFFSPANISVNRGEVVEFEFTNTGNIAHNFIIRNAEGQQLGGTDTIPAGATDSFTAQMPDEETTIEFTSFCSVPGHEESGMVGTITVQ